jgi:hypothetical protein
MFVTLITGSPNLPFSISPLMSVDSCAIAEKVKLFHDNLDYSYLKDTGENCLDVAGRQDIINLSNSTREAIPDCAACAMHNRLRIETHRADTGQPTVRQVCSVPGKAFLDLFSSMHQQNEY